MIDNNDWKYKNDEDDRTAAAAAAAAIDFCATNVR